MAGWIVFMQAVDLYIAILPAPMGKGKLSVSGISCR
jgi:hypothetical protein